MNARTIRSSPGGNLHLVSKDSLYLMAPSWIVIYKCRPVDCPSWENSSGNLLVEGSLEVKGSVIVRTNFRCDNEVWARVWAGTSDIRLKENIKNISQNDKDKVLQLVPKTYNMIDDENKSKRYGLIEQEVEELYPELVSKDNKGMKAINYIELIPLLLEQIKELKKSVPNQNTINTNVINIGGVTLTSNDLLKLKQLINQ